MRRVLVTDWDETATEKDTTALVALVAYARNAHVQPFEHFSRIYMAASDKYNAACATTCGARATRQDEIDYQRGMRDVEWSSIGAIEAAGLFKGLRLGDFAEYAPQVELRPGFVDFMRQLRAQDVPTYVLSVNWSKTLIEAVLRRHRIDGVTVLANELETDALGVTTGKFCDGDIRTGYDKMVQLDLVRKAHPDTDIVYVGDSSGDVLPTLDADTGIVIAGGRGRAYYASVEPLTGSPQLKRGIYEGTWDELRGLWDA